MFLCVKNLVLKLCTNNTCIGLNEKKAGVTLTELFVCLVLFFGLIVAVSNGAISKTFILSSSICERNLDAQQLQHDCKKVSPNKTIRFCRQ